tara:strand:+ start:252 stop:437 length:186 start_codon:yes stop_codon:yes gene_type:complete
LPLADLRNINNMRTQGEKIISIWSKNRKNRLIVTATNRRTPSFYKKILPVSIKVKQGVYKH